MSNVRWFSCRYCGTRFEVYPPDDDHPTAVLEKPKEADGAIVEMTYDCKNNHCGRPTTLYWYRKKLDVGFG
jgi:hypothetical protein